MALPENTSVKDLGKGSKIWYRKDVQTWLPGELISRPDEATCTVLLENGCTSTCGLDQVQPKNPDVQDGIHDLIQLSFLNEPAILHNLLLRYKEDNIYTNVGPVLVAMNPCKQLPLYTQEMAVKYKGSARESTTNLEPHIYLVAGNAFRCMVREGVNQSLVINGESGAGKTETTKKAMQYFATLAGGTGVEDQVLETNPILEAFGNAKTLRNHNSSRFGKLIEIHFNKTHHICGAKIRTYLLEKSRVVHRLKGERSYHIFYQLIRGASNKERNQYHLPPNVTFFKYLNTSGCTDIDGVDDATQFLEVQHALSDISISQREQAELWSLLSGILWLGNLEFDSDTQDDSAHVRAGKELTTVASLLSVTEEQLCMALTTREIKTRDELITKKLNMDEAKETRDALAKALYAGVFKWVVDRVNAKLDLSAQRRSSCLSISILDIYGFEQFDTNSFEQLCINYANERLQQQFTHHLFTQEQEEYEQEGINWQWVTFKDNQDNVDVIEAAPPKGLGVLAVLDSQCKFPKATDSTLMLSLKDQFGSHPLFTTDPRRPMEFGLQHYAGLVQYHAAQFLDKNKDTLNNDLVVLMQNSSSDLVRFVGDTTARLSETRKTAGQTVAGRFTQQLRELITMLDSTGMHFVRCIKPNGSLSPSTFESPLILQQLRCCGVLEVARVSQAGFPTKYLHDTFVERYKVLLRELNQDVEKASPLEGCKRLLEHFKVGPSKYQVGRTKVFFRPGVLGYVEDTWANMQRSAVTIQSCVRMWILRERYRRCMFSALWWQNSYRALQARRLYAVMVRRHQAATVLQKHWKGHVARESYAAGLKAIWCIQMAVRRFLFNMKVARRRAQREKREQEEREAEERRVRMEESFEAMKSMYGITDLWEVKAALAMYVAHRDRIKAEEETEDLIHHHHLDVIEEEEEEEEFHMNGPLRHSVANGYQAPGTAPGGTEGEEDAGNGGDAEAIGYYRHSNGGDVLSRQTSSCSHPSQSDRTSTGGVVSPLGSSRLPHDALPDEAESPCHQQEGLLPSPRHTEGTAPSQGELSPRSSSHDSGTNALAQLSRKDSQRDTYIMHADRFQQQELELDMLKKKLQMEKMIREKYAHKLEEQAQDWMRQVLVLQEYIHTIRSQLDQQQLHSLPPFPQPYPGSPTRSDAGTAYYSIMDRAPSTIGPPGSPAYSTLSNKMAQLQCYFDKHTNIMEDDALFIAEVTTGQEMAPNMDVAHELEEAKQRFLSWKQEYKSRLKTLEKEVKRRQLHRTVSGASQDSFQGLGLSPLVSGPVRLSLEGPGHYQPQPVSSPVGAARQLSPGPTASSSGTPAHGLPPPEAHHGSSSRYSGGSAYQPENMDHDHSGGRMGGGRVNLNNLDLAHPDLLEAHGPEGHSRPSGHGKKFHEGSTKKKSALIKNFFKRS